MATTTVYSGTADGYIASIDNSSNYSAARAGTGDLGLSKTDNTTTLVVGQLLDGTLYQVLESFLNFDLFAAGLTSSSPVTAAALSLWPFSDFSTSSDFTIEARTHDWGAALTTADWVAGASLSGKTLLASVSTSGLSTGAYVSLTESGTALKDAVITALAGDGVLRVLLCSDRQVSGSAPTGYEFVYISPADETGTTQDPKLLVTYTSPTVVPRSLTTLGCGA